MGMMLRDASALGAHALIFGENSCHPYLRRSVRNSMGTIFDLPMIESPNLRETLELLKSQGVQCVAAHPRADSKNPWEIDFARSCCVVLGGEGPGFSEEVVNACHERVSIPMRPSVNSLNVGCAAAALLYEVGRQRGWRHQIAG